MDNVIYAYRKLNEDKIVYVGQTVNLPNRHYRHVKIDPYDSTLKEYNYPLSKGIRKYGEDAYELIILESNLSQSQLNERERYWISYYDTYYHGYNQSLGGSNPVMVQYNEDEIDYIIYLLKETTKTFKEISEECNVSLTHVYNINIGARRKRDDLKYPIRKNNTKGTKGLKFSPEECINIHETIINNPTMKFTEIAKKFNCSDVIIREINQGKTKAYRLEQYNYPLRNSSDSQKLKGRF